MTHLVRSQLPTIIGLAGFKRSGKDTLAGGLCDFFGFRKLSFGAAIREEVAQRFAVSPVSDKDKDKPLNGDCGQSYRELLLTHGMARRMAWPTYWIDKLATEAHQLLDQGDRIVISDVRMPDEIDWIRKNRGVVVWINRPGVASDGESTEQDNRHLCDYVVENNNEVADPGELSGRANEMILTSPTQLEIPVCYWTVIGRIPGDDEDSVEVITGGTHAEAIKTFDRLVWEDVTPADELVKARQSKEIAHGSTTYINHVLQSTAPVIIT